MEGDDIGFNRDIDITFDPIEAGAYDKRYPNDLPVDLAQHSTPIATVPRSNSVPNVPHLLGDP